MYAVLHGDPVITNQFIYVYIRWNLQTYEEVLIFPTMEQLFSIMWRTANKAE